jgi:hypothetical protein
VIRAARKGEGEKGGRGEGGGPGDEATGRQRGDARPADTLSSGKRGRGRPVLEWFEKNEKKLVFDRKTRKYAVRGENGKEGEEEGY